jgi:glycosyltransferase involved in cell wall biosynthesis
LSSAQESLSLAFYCPCWPPGKTSNGIVTYVGAIVPALEAQGHVVSILSRSPAGRTTTAGVYDIEQYKAGHTLAERLLDRLAWLRGCNHGVERVVSRSIAAATGLAITEHGVHLLEIEESFGWPLGVRRKIPIPLVVRLHGPWFLTGPANGYPADTEFRTRVTKEGLGLGAADGITAPSVDVLERTRAYYGLALEHAEVIPNPVPDVPASKCWNPAECEPYEILFIGRFDRLKGGDLIIDAFSRVVARLPQARLRFVGSDPGIQDSAGKTWMVRDYIEDRIPEAWKSGRVQWLDRQPHAALADLRRSAALTVVCSRYETFGLTATEAMSQGCPLVATAAGALSEIVQDGVNGLVCRPDDPEDLAEKLCLLLENPPYAERLGRQAAVDSRRRYDPGLLAARTVDYYQRVIARARTNHSTPSILQ